MTTKHQILIAFSLILSITACENAVKEKEEIKTEIKVEETAHKDENKVQLNDGVRWAANAETTEGVNNMIKITDLFTTTENEEAFKTLTDSLEAEFAMIFKKCTMKGEAHNQLVQDEIFHCNTRRNYFLL